MAALCCLGASPLAQAAESQLPLCEAVAGEQATTTDGFRMVAGSDGWLFRDPTDLFEDYGHTPEGAAGLTALRDALAARGTTLVVVRLPPRGVVHADQLTSALPKAQHDRPARAAAAYEAHIEWLRKTGVEVVDVAPAMRALTEPSYYPRDHHWTTEGATAAATTVAKHIQGLLGSTPLPAAAFEQREGASRTVRGALLARVEGACGPMPQVPDQALPGLQSVPVQGALDAAALFGEASPPEVVVVGDSQVNRGSRDVFYFVGQLRETLGTEVFNAGIDGGMLFPPLQSYLGSEAFDKHPPRFVVWVSAAHLKVHHPGQLRQVVPVVKADCSAAAAPQPVALSLPGTPSQSARTSLPTIATPPALLRFELDDPALLKLRLRLFYEDGTSEAQRIRRNPRVGLTDPVWLEALPDRGALQAVQLVPLDAGRGEVRVQVCAERPAR